MSYTTEESWRPHLATCCPYSGYVLTARGRRLAAAAELLEGHAGGAAGEVDGPQFGY